MSCDERHDTSMVAVLTDPDGADCARVESASGGKVRQQAVLVGAGHRRW